MTLDNRPLTLYKPDPARREDVERPHLTAPDGQLQSDVDRAFAAACRRLALSYLPATPRLRSA